MSILQYDIVQGIADIPSDRMDRSIGADRAPQTGDPRTLVLVLADLTGDGAAFAVECVGSDGHTLWLANVLPSELERVSSGTGGV